MKQLNCNLPKSIQVETLVHEMAKYIAIFPHSIFLAAEGQLCESDIISHTTYWQDFTANCNFVNNCHKINI